MKKAEIGLIGLSVMGSNLALNISGKKIETIVFNRTKEKTLKFINEHGSKYLTGEKLLKTFISKLKTPKKIIIMIQAGDPIDEIIKQLLPHLKKNDIIIDCGNSNYKDTQRRFNELKRKGLNFIGCGVSGGEEGALKGPSLMPGGSKQAYEKIKPIFKKIAAKDFNKKATLTYVGENGAGHFVKTIHNGIEYAVMQMMAETYDLLKKAYDLSPHEIAEIFERYNKGKLKSYLFDISSKILKKQDKKTKKPLINYILDKAEQKGTGRWTAITSLEESIAAPSITESVYARIISSEKDLRTRLSKIYSLKNKTEKIKKNDFIKLLENGLYAGILSAYAQGYDLITKTAKKEKWTINLGEISRIWQGGCIIRAKILSLLEESYKKTKSKHAFEIPKIAKELKKSMPDLKEVTSFSIKSTIPTPALTSALLYFEMMTQEVSPANFIQGLRDYFGAHTYERTDKKGSFHTNWNQ
jgi:6-phosphogluconate dehydrogenase